MLICLMSKWLSDRAIVLVSFLVYCICCLYTNYYGLIQNSETLVWVHDNYCRIFCSFCNSFPVALIWLSLGKLFCKRDFSVGSKKTTWILLPLCMTLLYLEQYWILKLGISKSNNCYFMLILVCCLIFYLLLQGTFSCRYAALLRKISTIIYASHASVMMLTGFFSRRILSLSGVGEEISTLLITIAMCDCLALLLLRLERVRGFTWLRFSH